jgi:hypothetical protein
MGHGRWDTDAWAKYAARHKGKSRREIFTSASMNDAFDPAKVAVRESRDSMENPLSTAIILASDVTGSMGAIAEVMIRSGLDTTMREIYSRKPVTDPHVMVMAVGDAECDQAPLQATQFEADIRLAEQLKELWIEGGGGGNGGESYHLPWYFAAMKTSADCFEKRSKKGYLFTIGDEPILPGITKENLRRVFDSGAQTDLSSAELLAMASRSYEIFHVVLTNVGFASSGLPRVLSTWKPLLGERVIHCDDHEKVAEVIVSAIQVVEGTDKETVAGSWSGSTALTVAKAVKSLTRKAGGSTASPGAVWL